MSQVLHLKPVAKDRTLEVEYQEETDLVAPEKRLLAAFLDRMIKDALGLSVDVQRHYCRHARQWLSDGETVAPFSLVWTCQALDKPVERFVKFAHELNKLTRAEAREMVLRRLCDSDISFRGASPLNTCRASRRQANRPRPLDRLRVKRAKR